MRRIALQRLAFGSVMSEGGPKDVSFLLKRIRNGDRQAAESLMPLVYGELKALAGSFLFVPPAFSMTSTASLLSSSA